MVFVTFSYNTLNATCNMQQSQECPPVTAMSWGKTLNAKARYLAGGLVRVNPTFAPTKGGGLVGVK